MYDSVVIKNDGNFRLEVLLSGIPSIPAPNWRKICRLLWKNEKENIPVITALAEWFPQAVREAKSDVAQTDRLYHALWKDPAKAPKGKKAEYKKANQLLLQNTKDAQRKKQRLEANFKIFLEVC